MLTVLWVVALLTIALTSYAIWLRPALQRLPHLQVAYILANGFWQRLWVRLRAWWDMIMAAGLIILPEVPNLIDSITGVDLSDYFPPGAWKVITQLLGVSALLLRVFLQKKTDQIIAAPPVPPAAIVVAMPDPPPPPTSTGL